MKANMRPRSARRVMFLVLLVLSGALMGCSVSLAISWDDDDDSSEALATANAHLATRVASNEALISYLATAMPRAPRGERFPTFTPTPYLPVQGAVIIEGGRCCVGGTAGEMIQLSVGFRASSPVAEVVSMRIWVGNRPYGEREMAQVGWEPFVRQRRFPIQVTLNWVGLYVSVQYRDAQGNVSQVYVDDISIEGMPPTPTVSPD